MYKILHVFMFPAYKTSVLNLVEVTRQVWENVHKFLIFYRHMNEIFIRRIRLVVIINSITIIVNVVIIKVLHYILAELLPIFRVILTL